MCVPNIHYIYKDAFKSAGLTEMVSECVCGRRFYEDSVSYDITADSNGKVS